MPGNHSNNTRVFGPNAPSENLKFPARANMTILEHMAFRPYDVRNVDFIIRLIDAGGKPSDVTKMVNFYRIFDHNPTDFTTLLKQMETTMVQYGYLEWTPTVHKVYFPADGTEARDLIAVDGYANFAEDHPRHANGKGGVVVDFPIENFARDVRVFPQGYDAFEFTRCVRYSMEHPGRYLYPRDYEQLVAKLDSDQGPIVVTRMHCDTEVIQRWRTVVAYSYKKYIPANKQVTATASQAVEGGAQSEPGVQPTYADQFGAGREMEMAATLQPNYTNSSQNRAPGTAYLPSDTYGSANHHLHSNIENSAHYAIPSLNPPTPPTLPHTSQPIPTSSNDFQTNPALDMNPYAYGSPRVEPPFRALHLLHDPHPMDFSDWAENIRWAKEQWQKNGDAVWTEDEVHLGVVMFERLSNGWKSWEMRE